MRPFWITMFCLLLLLLPAAEAGKREVQTESGVEIQPLIDVKNDETSAVREAPAAEAIKESTSVYVDATGGNLSMKGVVTTGPVQIKMAPGTNIAWDASGEEDVTAGGIVTEDATTSAGVMTLPKGASPVSSVGVYLVPSNNTINGSWTDYATENPVVEALTLDNIGNFVVGDLNGETVYLPDNGKVYRLLGDGTLEEF